MKNDDDINGEDGSMDIHRELLFAAQDLRTLTSCKCEISVSRRLTMKAGAIKEGWDYLITFGDILNRGPWKWECAQADTLEQVVKITKAQITAQGDERAREFLQLQDAAAKLGLKLVEVGA